MSSFSYYHDSRISEGPLAVVEMAIRSKYTGRELERHSDGEPYLGILDTGSDRTWLPEDWIRELGIWENFAEVFEKGIRLGDGSVQQRRFPSWYVYLSLNGLVLQDSFQVGPIPPRADRRDVSQVAEYAVIGQDVLLTLFSRLDGVVGQGILGERPCCTSVPWADRLTPFSSA